MYLSDWGCSGCVCLYFNINCLTYWHLMLSTLFVLISILSLVICFWCLCILLDIFIITPYFCTFDVFILCDIPVILFFYYIFLGLEPFWCFILYPHPCHPINDVTFTKMPPSWVYSFDRCKLTFILNVIDWILCNSIFGRIPNK